MRETLSPIDRGRPFRPHRLATVAGLGLALAAGLALLPSAQAQPPGPESFAKAPTTPLELWDAADYLVRTGQSAQAAPFLKKFLAANPDDDTLLQIRDKYGTGSILRLQDDPATRDMAVPLLAKLNEATRLHATNPERLARAVASLTRSREEQDTAVERLREAGAYAVPPIVQELQKSSHSPDEHALLVQNLGRLDTTAVPPLVATLDAPVAAVATDAADALGRLGDARAVPALTAAAVTGKAPAAARRAVERLTGRPFDAQPKSPVRLLADEAKRYHTHRINFPGDPVVIWAWDDAAKAPVPKTVSKSDAEASFGVKYARAALAVDPTDRAAQVALVSLALEKAIERAGFDRFPAGDSSNTLSTAIAAGPAVLGDVLRGAIRDGKTDLAAVTATALGKVTDASALAGDGPGHPLVEALSAPGRRARFAAAKALVGLDPHRPFPGSSRVVPVLAQFLASRALPRAVVIDGNISRGNLQASFLKSLGFEPVVAPTGDEGFKVAAESADVELVLLDIHLIQGAWRLHDTLANLRADARTAGLPIYVYGPLNRAPDLASLQERFPGVQFLVTPTSPQTLDQQLGVAGRPQPLPAAERTAYAREATALLAAIAARPGNPFERELAKIEPTLAAALNTPETSQAASAALGDVALPAAQRGLADVVVDPSKPVPLRLAVAAQLARSVQRFGPLVAADQEKALRDTFDRETDPALRTALGAVIGNLRPKAAPTGERLRQLSPSPAPAPAGGGAANPASPSPEASPTPSETPSPNPPTTPPPGGEGRL
jgi:HEAT repeat protein